MISGKVDRACAVVFGFAFPHQKLACAAYPFLLGSHLHPLRPHLRTGSHRGSCNSQVRHFMNRPYTNDPSTPPFFLLPTEQKGFLCCWTNPQESLVKNGACWLWWSMCCLAACLFRQSVQSAHRVELAGQETYLRGTCDR
eukprot:1161263-Pelagomonas_calceolata.AAC.31